ncbi:MAG: hypothetical protein AB7P97_00800 [Hyphomonadaceae bacterium]
MVRGFLFAALLVMSAAAAAQTPEFGNPVGPGAWRIEVVRDVMTDRARARTVLVSEARNAALIIQCESGAGSRVYFGVEFQEYLGFSTDPIQEAMIRFDQEAPLTTRWLYENSIIQQTDQRRVAALVSVLRGARRVAVRALKWNLPRHNFVDATFDVTGSAEAIDAAYAACGRAAP